MQIEYIIIRKYKELVKTLDRQVKLVTGTLAIDDIESYGYHALAISQKITTLEAEISQLEKTILINESRSDNNNIQPS